MDRDNRGCAIPGCDKISNPSVGECNFCRRYLCDAHVKAPAHVCLAVDLADRRAIRDQAQRRELDELLETVLQIDIAGLAQSLRPGHHCQIHLPDDGDSASLKAGVYHIHLLVEFDDGVKMLARVRQTAFYYPRYEMGKRITESEVTTQRVMNVAGVPVPNAWLVSQPTGNLNICFVEYVNGKDCDELDTPFSIGDPATLTTIKDYAEIMVRLSKLQYPLIGSLTGYDSDVTVGPLIWSSHLQSDPPFFLGPFKSMADRYLQYVDFALKEILAGRMDADDPVRAYLIQLNLRELIIGDLDMRQPLDCTFIKHGDNHPGHIMVDDQGHITGLIDWEWASVTAKAEAFAAPMAFMDWEAFLQGSNHLGPLESILATTYDDLGRSDLGDCVRQGKKWQRLQFAAGFSDWEQLKALHELYEVQMMGNGTEESWLQAAKIKFAKEDGLRSLLAGSAAGLVAI